MALSPTKADRDARLDALAAAAKAWFKEEKARLNSETQFLQQILQARGANDAAALNLSESVSELEDEVSAYIFIDQGGT
jgi:hypothetical protein